MMTRSQDFSDTQAKNQGSPSTFRPDQGTKPANGASRSGCDAAPLLVFLITLFAFLPTLQNGFVEWDEKLLTSDANYRGLDWSRIVWMFSHVETIHYQPITWLTFGLDYVLWGRDPFGYHLTNLTLHAFSAVAVYFVTRRLISLANPGSMAAHGTIHGFRAVISALIFSLHPLRVETVALASARAGLLCGIFFLISAFFYLRSSEYSGVDRRGSRSMTFCICAFILSVLCSIKGIVLPFVFLLLDVYPLKRLEPRVGRPSVPDRGWLIGQKLGLLAIGLAVALSPQFVLPQAAGMVSSGDSGLTSALAYLSIAPMFYLWKTVMPIGFSLYYEFSFAYIVLGAISIAAISSILFIFRERFSVGLFAWTAYLLLILPGAVSGGVGMQMLADRNSYLPAIPLAILAGAVLPGYVKLMTRNMLSRWTPLVSTGFAVSLLTVLAALSWNLTQAWYDTESVLRRSADAGGSSTAYFELAAFLEAREKDEQAVAYYRHAIAVDPSRWDAHEKAGLLLYKQGRIPEAVPHLRSAVTMNPNAADSRDKLASALVTTGELGEAIQHFRKVLEIAPELNEARLKLATLMAIEGNLQEATLLFEQAVAREPGDARIHAKLAEVLAAQGKLDGAIQAFRRALKIRPEDAALHENLGRALIERGLRDEGAQHLRKAIAILQATPAAR
jgi:tetratricopeptide (TPR) repeat protein